MVHGNRTEYTLEDIAEANTPGNAWIVIHGKVYDVSSYLDDHPGGRDVLLELAGGDATNDFDFVGHSKSAAKAMAEFEVGAVAGYTVAPKRESRQQVIEPETKPQKLGNSVVPLLRNGAAVRAFAAVLSLFVASAYWSVKTKPRLSDLLSSVLVSQPTSWSFVLLLTLSTSVLIFSGRRYWHSLFHYKGVFEYPPHYTVQ